MFVCLFIYTHADLVMLILELVQDVSLGTALCESNFPFILKRK